MRIVGNKLNLHLAKETRYIMPKIDNSRNNSIMLFFSDMKAATGLVVSTYYWF